MAKYTKEELKKHLEIFIELQRRQWKEEYALKRINEQRLFIKMFLDYLED